MSAVFPPLRERKNFFDKLKAAREGRLFAWGGVAYRIKFVNLRSFSGSGGSNPFSFARAKLLIM